jgi:hypothetical protein
MKKLQYGLCILLVLGGLAHLVGTFAGYEAGSEIFVWSLAASAFVFVVAFLNVLRIRAPEDRLVAAGAIASTLVWIALALAFGQVLGNVADPRVLTHVAISAALLIVAVGTWVRDA